MVDTRDTIMLVAFKLFLVKGYKEVTLRDIITETNLSKGAFYHHFDSKEMLYREIVDRHLIVAYKSDMPTVIPDNQRFVDLLIEYFLKPITQLEGLAKEFGVQLSEINFYSFIFDMFKYYPGIITKIENNHAEEIKSIETLIAFAKKRNEIKFSIDSLKLANHIHSLMHGIFMLSFIETRNYNLTDSITELFEHLYSLIKQ